MRRAKRKSRSEIVQEEIIEERLENGTPELKRKHKLEWERLDFKGLFRRARVTDQLQIDRLFIDKKITGPQHEAGNQYLAALVKSGAFIRSPSFEKSIDASVKDVEKSISSRIMAVSGARGVLRRCGEDSMLLVDLLIGTGRISRPSEIPVIRRGLDALVRFYGTEAFLDPRDIKLF